MSSHRTQESSFNKTLIDRRIHDGSETTGNNIKANNTKDLNIEEYQSFKISSK